MAGGRTFLEAGDEVVLRYTAPGTSGGRIALGDVAGRVEPAR
jgi:fumarylacetoacetase